MSDSQTNKLRNEALELLRNLSPERLRVASDFLAYLQEREENEATEELLAIPGLQAALESAIAQAEACDTIRFADVRRDV
ncbi:MAG: hypothetical protein V1772_03300 [Chloroflexota bacterium]